VVDKTEYLSSNCVDQANTIAHGFFTRRGGVSQGIFESLNCSEFSGDSASAIAVNRNRVADALGGQCLVTNKQVHGNHVREVRATDDLTAVVEADGLVTRARGICLGALGADCAPVVFMDIESQLVAVAHAGWQGALHGITDSVLNAMTKLGSRPESVQCVIGPAIQLMSYEVGEKFRENFIAASYLDVDRFFSPHPDTGNLHFDLPEYLRLRLQEKGVSGIDCLSVDTYSDAQRFFSYRRSCHRGEKDYGRQVGAVCLL
jgi:YfiH family protein